MIVLDLPAPPSVNRMSRNRRGIPLGNRSPVVEKWRVESDAALLLAKKRWPPICGHFEIVIVFGDRTSIKDLDNRIKPLLDYLQCRCIIENDKFCDKITVSWGETKLGCRITLNSA